MFKLNTLESAIWKVKITKLCKLNWCGNKNANFNKFSPGKLPGEALKEFKSTSYAQFYTFMSVFHEYLIAGKISEWLRAAKFSSPLTSFPRIFRLSKYVEDQKGIFTSKSISTTARENTFQHQKPSRRRNPLEQTWSNVGCAAMATLSQQHQNFHKSQRGAALKMFQHREKFLRRGFHRNLICNRFAWSSRNAFGWDF